MHTYMPIILITSARSKVILIYRDVETCRELCVITCVHISQARLSAPAATPGSSRQLRASTRHATTASPARLGRFGTGARDLPRDPASSAESALPARTASGVSQASREAARRASLANTRQPRGQQRATHARLFQRASPGLTESTVAETLKGPAQGAEAARLEGTGSSAPRSRQDDALHVCQARTRPAPDPSPA